MTSLCWKTIPIHDFLVVHGYVHRECDLTAYIPDDITNFIVIWYYDVSTWIIEGNELNKFLNIGNGSAIYSKPFNIDGITFHCSLCPNGWKSNQNGFVQYYLEVQQIPSNISSFTVYFEFYCYETKSSWKGIRTLTKINDAVGWFHYTLPLEECKKIINLLNLKYLTFGCCVEILNINYLIQSDDTNEYKTEYESEYESKTPQKIRYTQNRHLTLNKYIQTTWMLNKYPLQRFKHCVYPKNFHSPSFENNYWCFECQANFEHNIMIYCRLKLIRMPYNIKNMKIKCKLQTNMKCETDKRENGMDEKEDNGEWEIVNLSFKHNYTKWKAYLTEEKHENSIRISCKIQILQLINWNNIIIHPSEWIKYGIINTLFQTDYNPLMSIQYTDYIEKNGKNQLLTNLQYDDNKQMIIKKQWIKPNFLNIPMS